jgi:hypothetical protein
LFGSPVIMVRVVTIRRSQDLSIPPTTILARRENRPTADASSSDSVRKTIVTKLKRIAANQCLQFTRKN